MGTAAPGTSLSPQTRKSLSAFLVKPAETALKKRNFRLAISLYRGIVAIRGEDSDSAWDLANAWILAGQFDAAADVLRRYQNLVSDPGKKARAASKIEELSGRIGGFSGVVFEPLPAFKEAINTFRRGRHFFHDKKYAEAILMYKAGYAMAPDLPGNLRELGAAYDKLGRASEANDFFQRYLQLRPFGKNANDVRRRLTKVGAVGTLSVATSFPCEIVMVNRELMPGKLPIKKLAVAPGKYKLLCYNSKYHFAGYREVDVDRGEKTKVTFEWAILENKLNPWGRIVIEYPDPKRRGEMYDVGLYDEVGVPVPEDHRALKMILRAGDGSKPDKEVYMKLEPGKKIPVTW